MFYSHEVLTSRKYGVATIWLVATLGQKSGLRKVSRKAVENVNVAKACEVIIAPQAPMALRLTANLLYGVSRVYNQQCEYMLVDAQHVHTKMQTMVKVMRSAAVASEVGRAHPEQLILPDDPAFFPDLSFESLDLSIPGTLYHDKESQLSSLLLQSQSPIDLQYSVSDHSGGLPFPDQDSSRVSGIGAAGFLEGLGGDNGLLDDTGFEIDLETGEIIEPVDPRAARGPIHHGESTGEIRSRLQGENAVVRIRPDGSEAPMMQDFDMPLAFDLPDADVPLPTAEGAGSSSSDAFAIPPGGEEQSSVSAPLRQRQPRTRRELPFDNTLILRTADLDHAHKNYGSNMEAASRHTLLHKASIQARKNAHWWILGQGFNGVRHGIGASEMQSPLNMFAGDALLAWVTGRPIVSLVPGRKRSSSEVDEADEQEGRQRLRLEDDGLQLGRAADDTGMQFFDEGTEIGRAAEVENEDVSSAMPWNISASIRGSSVSRGAGSALKPGGRASATPQNVNPATAALIQALTGRSIPPPPLFTQDTGLRSDQLASDIGMPFGEISGSEHGLPTGREGQAPALLP